jgi:hypothetical protein
MYPDVKPGRTQGTYGKRIGTHPTAELTISFDSQKQSCGLPHSYYSRP